ncbi:hypothetical protein M514_00381 [Trichuris suis]|nr:hypothetical protein M514_00381 [Trichuris suis]
MDIERIPFPIDPSDLKWNIRLCKMAPRRPALTKVNASNKSKSKLTTSPAFEPPSEATIHLHIYRRQNCQTAIGAHHWHLVLSLDQSTKPPPTTNARNWVRNECWYNYEHSRAAHNRRRISTRTVLHPGSIYTNRMFPWPALALVCKAARKRYLHTCSALQGPMARYAPAGWTSEIVHWACDVHVRHLKGKNNKMVNNRSNWAQA